ALGALEQQPFDLVLMDVEMPDMDGFEATAVIRSKERESGGHIRIIALTAHAMKGDRERCLAAGMDGYVSKPLEAQELFAVVEQLVPPPASGETVVATGEAAGVVFDQATALRRVGGDVQLLKDLVQVFLEGCPNLMAQIRRAVTERDAAKIHLNAHTLKGSAANFGAS